MSESEITSRLSGITTRWDLVYEAHRGRPDAVPEAQHLLLRRYCGAVYNYFLRAVRNPNDADDLCQEFAVRFLRGDFKRADPERGRFRDFLQKSLYHLVVDYHRQRQNTPLPLNFDSGLTPATSFNVEELDREFVAGWQQEVLERTWEALAKVEEQGGHLFYTVLRWRSEHPDAPAGRFAEQLSSEQGRPFTEVGVRQILHRARVRFAELLLEEVARSLDGATEEQLERELIDLGLLAYCQPALDRRARQA